MKLVTFCSSERPVMLQSSGTSSLTWHSLPALLGSSAARRLSLRVGWLTSSGWPPSRIVLGIRIYVTLARRRLDAPVVLLLVVLDEGDLLAPPVEGARGVPVPVDVVDPVGLVVVPGT